MITSHMPLLIKALTEPVVSYRLKFIDWAFGLYSRQSVPHAPGRMTISRKCPVAPQ